MGEEIFEGDGGEKYNDGGGGIVRRLRGEDFFDGLDDDMNAGDDNDEGDENGGGAFDFGAVLSEVVVAGEFFANYDKKARDGIDETMNGVGGDGDGTRDDADYNVKNAK